MVNVQVNANHTALVQCMKTRANITGMDAMEYPELAEIGRGYSIELPQNRLRDMITRSVFATATDESRQILTGGLL